MNWYKKAQTADFAVQWLRSARDQNIDISTMMQNMQALDPMMTPDDIFNSIQQAANMVSMEQGGQLTLTQQNLIQQITQNYSVVPEEALE